MVEPGIRMPRRGKQTAGISCGLDISLCENKDKRRGGQLFVKEFVKGFWCEARRGF